jgi:hypothetical protein
MSEPTKPTIDQLLKRLIEAKIGEAAALEREDMRAQNRWADRREAVIRDILSYGDEGRAALEGLLNHERPMIRLVAAAHVLKWSPERAIPMINELLAWSHAERDVAGRRPPIASFVSRNAQALLSLHYDIDINDVLPRVLGVEEK